MADLDLLHPEKLSPIQKSFVFYLFSACCCTKNNKYQCQISNVPELETVACRKLMIFYEHEMFFFLL